MRRAAVPARTFVAPAFPAAPAFAADRRMTVPHPPAMSQAASSGLAGVGGIRMSWAAHGADTGAHDPVPPIHGRTRRCRHPGEPGRRPDGGRLVIAGGSRGHGRSSRTGETSGRDLVPPDRNVLPDYQKFRNIHIVGRSGRPEAPP